MKKIMKSLIIGGVYVGALLMARAASAQTPLPTIVDPVPATPAVPAPVSAPAAVPAATTVVAPAAVPVAVPTQATVKPASKPATSAQAAVDSLSSLTAPGSALNTTSTNTANSGSNSAASTGNNANNSQIQQLSVNAKAASDALGRAVSKLSSIRGKIAARIDSAKKKGIPDAALADVRSKLATADNRIADSRNAADNLAIVPVSKGDIVSIIGALQAMDMSAKASIRQAQDALKTTLDALTAAEASIKK